MGIISYLCKMKITEELKNSMLAKANARGLIIGAKIVHEGSTPDDVQILDRFEWSDYWSEWRIITTTGLNGGVDFVTAIK